MRWYDEIIKHSDELATLITAECGKPMVESLGEVSYGATFIKWMIEEGKRTYGRTLPIAFNKQRMSTIRQPVGVCGLITPWNFPFVSFCFCSISRICSFFPKSILLATH